MNEQQSLPVIARRDTACPASTSPAARWRRVIAGLLAGGALLVLSGCGLTEQPPAQVIITATLPAAPTVTPAPSLTPLLAPTFTPAEAAPALTPTLVQNALTGDEHGLYLRSSPSTMSTILTVASNAAPLTAVGRSSDSRWVQVQMADGRTGWLMAGSVALGGDITVLPVTGEADNTLTVAIVPLDRGGLALLQSPQGSRLATLDALTPLRVDARSPDNAWLLVTTNTAQQGWVAAEGLALAFALDSIQAVVVPTVPPQAVVQAPPAAQDAAQQAPVQAAQGDGAQQAQATQDAQAAQQAAAQQAAADQQATQQAQTAQQAAEQAAWAAEQAAQATQAAVAAAQAAQATQEAQAAAQAAANQQATQGALAAQQAAEQAAQATQAAVAAAQAAQQAQAVAAVPGGSNASVRLDAGGLRLRQLPSTDSTVLFNLQAGTPLVVTGRTEDNTWVQVRIPEGFEGWLAAQYLDFNTALAAVPAIAAPQPAPYVAPAPPPDAPAVSSVANVGSAREAYLRGQQLGNRRDVLTTVGDSITDTPEFLHPFFYGTQNLRNYGYLLPVIQYFNTQTGYGGTFERVTWTGVQGFTTASVLDPAALTDYARQFCQPGETPLDCEYRVIRPAVALVQLGTNDMLRLSMSEYETNLRRILAISADHGVVAVLVTIPPRDGMDDAVNQINGIVRRLAGEYSVPLYDLYSALLPLPNRGLGPDGVHLSTPPGGTAAAVDFSAANLAYGMTMHNLTALQALQAALEGVMY